MSQIIEIQQFDSPHLDIYARWKEAQLYHLNEPALGVFIAESPNVIQRAIDGGYTPISFLVSREQFKKEASAFMAQFPDVPFYTASEDILSNLTGFQLTRGILCAMNRLPYPTLSEICKDAKRIVLLEQVMNPTNVGAIFRSAAALNMDAILLSKGCSDPLYRRAARVSMGTVFQIPWTFAQEEFFHKESDTISYLQSLGFKTVSMALTDKSVSIDDESLLKEDKLAILLGTEGEGLSNETIQGSDYTVRIPMSHGVDSLNVAAASAVAFWQLGKRS